MTCFPKISGRGLYKKLKRGVYFGFYWIFINKYFEKIGVPFRHHLPPVCSFILERLLEIIAADKHNIFQSHRHRKVFISEKMEAQSVTRIIIKRVITIFYILSNF